MVLQAQIVCQERCQQCSGARRAALLASGAVFAVMQGLNARQVYWSIIFSGIRHLQRRIVHVAVTSGSMQDACRAHKGRGANSRELLPG